MGAPLMPKNIQQPQNHRTTRRRRSTAGAVVVLLFWSQVAWGQSAAVFPNGANVAITQPTAVPVTWILKDPASGAATSPQGLFRQNSNCTGEIFGTVGTPLTANVSGGVGLVGETLVIPQEVTNRAQARSLTRFFYCRDFSMPGGSTQTTTVTCRPGGSAFANFSIARIDVLFQNQRTETTVNVNTPDLQVYADVRYNGTGVLKAQWEILEPGGLAASGFRILDRMEKFIPFGDRIIIQRPQVPPLPTNVPGEYRVRLRILDPATAVTLPTARYFVEAKEDIRASRPIRLVSPVEGTLPPLGEIEFRWLGIPGAAQYRLEVAEAETLLQPGVDSRIAEGNPTQSGAPAVRQSQLIYDFTKTGPPALVAMVPPKSASYRTRTDQLQKLRPGTHYIWRVQALDDKGQVIGESIASRFLFSGTR